MDKKFSQNNYIEYDSLIELLTVIPGPEHNKKHSTNKKLLRFIDAPAKYSETGYVDPWGQRFNIYLDLNYDDKVAIGGKEEAGTVFVYSSGPNKIDEEGGGDDICSWKDQP